MSITLSEYFQKNTLRIKITGNCNMNCSFCHGEGFMHGLDNISPDNDLFCKIKEVCKKEAIKDIVITGGEPLLNSDLSLIISGISKLGDIDSIRLVTNGTVVYSLKDWNSLVDAGLSSVTFSIHDYNNININGEGVQRQLINIQYAKDCKINTKINIVVFDKISTLNTVYNQLLDITDTDFVLLNNVYNVEKSKDIINLFLEEHCFIETQLVSRNGTSNNIKEYQNNLKKIIYVKQHFLYRNERYCNNCALYGEGKCSEGYYGLRLEKYNGQYFIRACLDRHDPMTRIPVADFCKS